MKKVKPLKSFLLSERLRTIQASYPSSEKFGDLLIGQVRDSSTDKRFQQIPTTDVLIGFIREHSRVEAKFLLAVKEVQIP